MNRSQPYWPHSNPEPPSADLSPAAGYTAEPTTDCLNGCQAGSGQERQPVQTEGPSLICPDCLKKLARWLRQISERYALLPRVLDHGSVPADPGTKATKRPDPPAPMRLEVVDQLDTRDGRGVLGLVHAWAQMVRDERRMPDCCTCGHMALGHVAATAKKPAYCSAKACTCTTYRPVQATVVGECNLLIANLPWIVAQPWVGDLFEELRVLHRQLGDVVGERRRQPIAGGKSGAGCVAEVDGAVCGGPLFQKGHGADTEVRCARCGDTTTVERLQELGLVVGLLGDDGRSRLEAS